ncbi:hypothetical protein HRbin23_00892 [bacterium HR23]|nr:hypothetical protein HRbin23_00892 [bacterium HR23]
MVFSRKVQGRVLTFGVSGLLRQSNLIMWDRQTESWWQQGTFDAIVGDLAGEHLDLIPATILSWQEFRQTFPQGRVLSPDSYPFYVSAGIYGSNPYDYYDSASRPPLFAEPVDPRLPAMERVVAFSLGTRRLAIPFSVLAQSPVLPVEGDVVVFYAPNTRSPLDSPVLAEGRRVGTAGVYRSVVLGQRLSFKPVGPGRFQDEETGSVWNVFGVAVEGRMQGKRLPPVFHTQSFWFYEAVAFPHTEVLRPQP